MTLTVTAFKVKRDFQLFFSFLNAVCQTLHWPACCKRQVPTTWFGVCLQLITSNHTTQTHSLRMMINEHWVVFMFLFFCFTSKLCFLAGSSCDVGHHCLEITPVLKRCCTITGFAILRCHDAIHLEGQSANPLCLCCRQLEAEVTWSIACKMASNGHLLWS